MRNSESIQQAVAAIRDAAFSDGGAVTACPGTLAARVKEPLTLRPASRADATAVAEWLSGEDMKYLGGATDMPHAAQVEAWIGAALAGFVLEQSDEPIGFVVLEHGDDFSRLQSEQGNEGAVDRVEIGRLVIRLDRRKLGYGTALIMHLYAAYLKYREALEEKRSPCEVFLRVDRDNRNCRDFLNTLPLIRAYHDEGGRYLWFTVATRDRVHRKTIGAYIAERRKEAGFTQGRLAFLAGMEEGTLAMTESGARQIRLEDASQILTVLCKEPAAEIEFAATILKFYFDRSSWTYTETLVGELHNGNQSLWIFSDVLAENTREDDGVLETSIKAVYDGYERYYFVPSIYRSHWIDDLARRFAHGLKESGIECRDVDRRVRFYCAPEALCMLRLAVHDPAAERADARKITIGTNEENRRVDLCRAGDAMTKNFVALMRGNMRAADSAGGVSDIGELKRIPIPWSDYYE